MAWNRKIRRTRKAQQLLPAGLGPLECSFSVRVCHTAVMKRLLWLPHPPNNELHTPACGLYTQLCAFFFISHSLGNTYTDFYQRSPEPSTFLIHTHTHTTWYTPILWCFVFDYTTSHAMILCDASYWQDEMFHASQKLTKGKLTTRKVVNYKRSHMKHSWCYHPVCFIPFIWHQLATLTILIHQRTTS